MIKNHFESFRNKRTKKLFKVNKKKHKRLEKVVEKKKQ